MKRLLTFVVLVCAVTIAANAMAEKSKETAKEKPKTMVFKGEIVDMGCYLGHGARGEKHMACATKCIAGGMPMGLLTADGKLYLLTLDHDDADPYNQSKDMAAQMVEITGMVMERDGVSAIDVTGVKAMAAASSSKKK